MIGKPSEEIKEKLDIVDVISEYIKVTPAGMENFKARCPFHNEKTPSFMVSRSKQIFKCFGCQEGGDVFSFVMKMEGIEFVDALRELAKKAGVEMKQQNPEVYSRRNRVLDILELAANYYHQALLKSKSGKIARDYIAKRKLKDLTIDEFKLGFCPDDWEMLSKFLRSRGFKDDEILASGMVAKRQSGSGYYDRFRFRLMFPIWDVQGRVVGFTARALKEDEKMGKYINTPQGLAYDKSRVLYGLDKAKSDIRREGRMIIVEGNMDVIASHQVGVKNVIASSGTALTESQIEIIKRYTENIVFAFDMDTAGDVATQRGIDLAIAGGLNVKIVVPGDLDEVKDPDDIIKTKGVEVWKKMINNAKSVMDYYFESTMSKLDLSKVDDKKIAAKELLPKIKNLPDEVEQTHYLQKLGGLLGVDEGVLREAISKVVDKSEKYGNKALKTAKNKIIKKNERELIQERLFGLIMVYPDYLKKMKEFNLMLLDERFQGLYKKIKEYYNKNKSFDFDSFTAGLKGNSADLELSAKEFVLIIENEQSSREKGDLFDEEKEVDKCLSRLIEIDLRDKLKKIETGMRSAENEKDKKLIEGLSKQFNDLSLRLKKL